MYNSLISVFHGGVLGLVVRIDTLKKKKKLNSQSVDGTEHSQFDISHKLD